MTSQTRKRMAPLLVALAAAAIGLAAPGSTATLAHEADGRPARIHEGACAALGPVAYELTGVGAAIGADGTPIPAPEVVGSQDAIPVEIGATTLEVKMADLSASPYAIAVYESDEAMDRMLACGNVGGAMMMQMPGMPMPGDELAVWLAPQGDSAYTGVALLRSEVGGAASVTVMLGEGLAGGAMPGATPASG